MKISEQMVVLVTGGANGLGLATVELLVQLGAKVCCVDYSAEGLQAVSDRFPQILCLKCDVSVEKEAKDTVEKCVKHFGELHVLVNSAGINIPSMFLTKKNALNTEQMQQMFQVNVFGTLYFCKYASIQMSKQELFPDSECRGAIINISSIAATEGIRGYVSYSATKGAILGMAMPMARDLGRFGIRVMTVQPGLFPLTQMGKITPLEMHKKSEWTVALKRLGEAKDIAHSIQFCIENDYMTGTGIRVDGGIVAAMH